MPAALTRGGGGRGVGGEGWTCRGKGQAGVPPAHSLPLEEAARLETREEPVPGALCAPQPKAQLGVDAVRCERATVPGAAGGCAEKTGRRCRHPLCALSAWTAADVPTPTAEGLPCGETKARGQAAHQDGRGEAFSHCSLGPRV